MVVASRELQFARISLVVASRELQFARISLVVASRELLPFTRSVKGQFARIIDK